MIAAHAHRTLNRYRYKYALAFRKIRKISDNINTTENAYWKHYTVSPVYYMSEIRKLAMKWHKLAEKNRRLYRTRKLCTSYTNISSSKIHINLCHPFDTSAWRCNYTINEQSHKQRKIRYINHDTYQNFSTHTSLLFFKHKMSSHHSRQITMKRYNALIYLFQIHVYKLFHT
jgi:hypothetical protein